MFVEPQKHCDTVQHAGSTLTLQLPSSPSRAAKYREIPIAIRGARLEVPSKIKKHSNIIQGNSNINSNLYFCVCSTKCSCFREPLRKCTYLSQPPKKHHRLQRSSRRGHLGRHGHWNYAFLILWHKIWHWDFSDSDVYRCQKKYFPEILFFFCDFWLY